MATISMLSKTRAKVAEFGDKLFTLKMLGGNKEFARLQTLLKNGEIEFVRSEITKHTNSRGSTEVNLYRSTNFVVQPEKMEKYVGVSNMDAWKQIYPDLFAIPEFPKYMVVKVRKNDIWRRPA